MAAKLILVVDGAAAREYPLTKERMTIGRKKHNDIVVENLAVSGEHAAIVTIMHDSFLEDLDSTNGVQVNGAPAKKHFLQNNDVIQIGPYQLKYLTDRITQMTAAEYERTMVMRSSVNKPAASAVKPVEPISLSTTQTNLSRLADDGGLSTGKFEMMRPPPAPSSVTATSATGQHAAAQPAVAGAPRSAMVQILSGPSAGKELELVKNLTTLGKPGVQVAVLTRRPHGFFITHVEGSKFPLVNGQALSNQPRQLHDHDLIELAGIKMEFYFRG
jgi:pSer/pThr/pTyr-binding forkhead associated (FHA) protein